MPRMAQPRRTVRRSRHQLALQLHPRARFACVLLNVVPLAGLGAIWAGWRNPHSGLRRNGALQATLVLLGSWPLVVPGLAGFVWACWDAGRIARASLLALPPPGTDSGSDATPQKGARQ